MNRKISILGCGWLGLPLAKSLRAKDIEVKGSTTSKSKLEVLKNAGILAFQIEIGENEIEGKVNSFLESSDILIINIPPKLKSDSSENFVQKIVNFVPFIEKSSIKKVIFVSSISVYADTFPIKEIDEDCIPNPNSESGKQLLMAENILLSNSNFNTVVLRFGGLIGEDRHPISFLEGKIGIENPNSPVNLIEKKDCIGIIEMTLNQVQFESAVFNAVSPHHPTRKEYYQKMALERNLKIPEFNKSKKSVGKLINSNKVENVLGYKFTSKI